MTEPWQIYTPEYNGIRMEAGPGVFSWTAAATALAALAASFEVQQGVLAAHTGAVDVLWPGLTVAARAQKLAEYSAWLQAMVAECSRLAASAVVIAEAYAQSRGDMVPSAAAIQNRVDQATAVATNFMGINTPLITFLDATYMEHWVQNAAAMSVYDAQVIAAAAPVPKVPPPLLVNPAEPALDAAQQTVGQLAQTAAQNAASPQQMQELMGPLQQAMSAPQQLMSAPQQLMSAPQQLMSAPQQLMSQFMSGFQGMDSGGVGDGIYSATLGTPGAVGGGGVGGGAAGLSGVGGGGVGSLRAPLAAAPAANSGAGLAGASGPAAALSGSRSAAVPAAGPGMPMGGSGAGAHGMRASEGRSSETVSVPAGAVEETDHDAARAAAIISQALSKGRSPLH